MNKIVTIAAVAALATLTACGSEDTSAPTDENTSAAVGDAGGAMDESLQESEVSAETEAAQ